MPIRKKKAATTCDLSELLNWVAHDNFAGPEPTPAEIASQVFGDVGDVEQIEIAQFSARQLEEVAMSDILAALRDGDIQGFGKFTDLKMSPTHVDWTRQAWAEHGKNRTPVDKDFWSSRGINWRNSSVKSPHGEFQEVIFAVGDAMRVWPLTEDQFADDSASPTINEIPASDRYVKASDNQPKIDELRGSLSDLISAVAEHRANDFQDKEGRLAELAALDVILAQPQISLPLVEKILNETVRYLATRFSDNAVGLAAQAVITLAFQAFLNGMHP